MELEERMRAAEERMRVVEEKVRAVKKRTTDSSGCDSTDTAWLTCAEVLGVAALYTHTRTLHCTAVKVNVRVLRQAG